MASIEARPHASGESTWRVVWREDGRKQSEIFSTEDAAEQFRLLVKGSGERWPTGWIKGRGIVPDASSGPTFADWAERAIGRRTKANARTRADYQRDVDRYMAPHFGSTRIDAITEDHVADWIAALVKLGRAAKTISNLHGLASSIMDDALTGRPALIEFNPFAGHLSQLPDARAEDMEFLTPAEFESIFAYVPDWYRPLAILLAGTGLRFGEATALRVRDVDLLAARPTLRVVRAWKRAEDSTYYIGEPKTRRSRRTIGVSAELVDALLPLVAGKRGDDLVVTSVNGYPLLNSTFHDVAWEPAVARARVCEMHRLAQRIPGRKPQRVPAPCTCAGVLDKRPRVHDLRHTHVAWLIADGIGAPAISRRLGHASITTTIDRYGHLLPDMDDDINAAVDRALTLRTSGAK